MDGQKSLTFFYLLLSYVFLILSDVEAQSHVGKTQLQTYIVHVHPTATTVLDTSDDRKGWYSSFLPAVETETTAEPRFVHMYTNVASGFAARLTEQELADLSKMDGFVHAYPDRLRSVQTTHTPNFLGFNLQHGLWNVSGYGDGVIVGVIDGGIFPGHPSFNGEGMPPPPTRWKGGCDFNASVCNNKLIGARSFISGAAAMKGVFGTTTPPVDNEGHGTHTASTAAGAFVRGAEALGEADGTASGMAPKAHLAIYKVCSEDNCADSDILAAMDAAVSDGVDVLSLSIGGGQSFPFYQDSLAVGAFGAIEKGVFVSCAAGNSGPNASSLSNEAPWILTVAASTMDRSVRATVKLGDGVELDGESLFQPRNFTPTFYPLVYAGASRKPGAEFCGNTSLNGINVRGKIVLCHRGGGIARIAMGANVKKAGGAGMILLNKVADGYSTLADAHVLPASNVGYSDGAKIMAYVNSTSNPTAAFLFKGTVLGTSPAPAIASFSSRGPSLQSPGILKPDIAGPGVSVLAAWPFSIGGSTSDSVDGMTFNVISGTSMSTPHLSGISALIKAAHPDWSPAAIKSAMMTTADVVDRSGKPIVDERLLAADLFALGSGHVNPSRATDPGLVYDLSADDYIPYICGLGYTDPQVGVIVGRRIKCSKLKTISEGELNYPSISVSLGGTNGSVTLERTVKNVGEANSTYLVSVEAPAGVSVVVRPSRLQFSQLKEEQKFSVSFSGSGRGGARVSQGSLSWISNKRTVRSPISVIF